MHGTGSTPKGPGIWSSCCCSLRGCCPSPRWCRCPFLLLLLDYWPLGQVESHRPLRCHGPEDGPVGSGEDPPVSDGSALFCVAVFVLEELVVKKLIFINIEAIPFGARCTNAVVVYTLYLVKTVWSSGLAAFYPYPAMRPLWQVAGSAVILIAITLFCLRNIPAAPLPDRRVALVRGNPGARNRTGSGRKLLPCGPFYLRPAHWRFYYGCLGRGPTWWQRWRVPRPIVAAVSGAVLVAFAVCAHIQTGYWEEQRDTFQPRDSRWTGEQPCLQQPRAVLLGPEAF